MRKACNKLIDSDKFRDDDTSNFPWFLCFEMSRVLTGRFFPVENWPRKKDIKRTFEVSISQSSFSTWSNEFLFRKYQTGLGVRLQGREDISVSFSIKRSKLAEIFEINDQFKIRKSSDDCRGKLVDRLSLTDLCASSGISDLTWTWKLSNDSLLLPTRLVGVAEQLLARKLESICPRISPLFSLESWILHRISHRYLNLQITWRATEGSTLLGELYGIPQK